ncbi:MULTISPECIES: hypothetical protein [unclassified Microcoleus]|uniref:hypothetical protein n=1 Tax=unclassified Microcoleus TaxID=2642155 RepID=UPI002FCFF569
MTAKILCPGWDNLSKEQKELATEWIKSLISFRITTVQLSDSLFDESSDNSLNPIDNAIKNFQFEVVDSSSTSEGINIKRIIPPGVFDIPDRPPDAIPQLVCLVNCWRNGHADCDKRCSEVG